LGTNIVLTICLTKNILYSAKLFARILAQEYEQHYRSDFRALTSKLLMSTKGSSSGVASLSSRRKIKPFQIQDLRVRSIFIRASGAFVRADMARCYRLNLHQNSPLPRTRLAALFDHHLTTAITSSGSFGIEV